MAFKYAQKVLCYHINWNLKLEAIVILSFLSNNIFIFSLILRNVNKKKYIYYGLK